MTKRFIFSMLAIIILALILTSCFPSKEPEESNQTTLILKSYTLEKTELNTRLIFQGDELKTSGVKITAVFNLKDKDGYITTIPEELVNAIKENLVLNRIFKSGQSLDFSAKINSNGTELVIEAVDNLSDLSLDSATVISYSITTKNEEIKLNDTEIKIESNNGLIAEGHVLYVKEPISIKDEFTENGYEISLDNSDQLKDFSLYYYFEDLNGSIIKQGEPSDGKFVVEYNKIRFDEDYKVKVKISYKNQEVQIIEKTLTTNMDNTVSVVSQRSESNPENVTIYFNMPHKEILNYSKAYYEVTDEDGNTVVERTEVSNAENITIDNLPNDKLYKIKVWIDLPNGQEKLFEGTIRMHITKIPKLNLTLDTIINSKAQSSLIQGILIRTEDMDEIERYLGQPNVDYTVSLKFYVKNGDSYVFNKYLTDFYNSLNIPFSLKYGCDFYIKYEDIKDSPEELANIIASIKDKEVRIVASVNKLSGRWVDTFDNPEAFTNIESNEIGPIQTIIFTQYISGIFTKVKANTAEINIPESILDDVYKDALRKEILIVLNESITDKWGYYVYDLKNNTKVMEEYNGMDVEVDISKDDYGLKINIKYNETDRELKVYYLFDNGFNIEYDDWKKAGDILMLKKLVKKYSAYIGSTLKKKTYNIAEKTFKDYFNGPIELNPNEVLFTRNDVYWSGSGYALSEAIRDGAVVKIIIRAISDGNEIDSYETGVGTSRFKISNLQPGMKYKMKVEFLSSDNEILSSIESAEEFYKYMMLPALDFYVTEVKKDLETKTFDATLTIDYPYTSKYGVTDFYVVIVNKTDKSYQVLDIPSSENSVSLTDLELDKLWEITVIPWVEGKYDYLKEVTGADEDNIKAYIENHIAKAIMNDDEGNAREFYYKSIIDSDTLPIKKLFVRNVYANGLDVTVTPKLYLNTADELSMKIHVNIKDPNGEIQNELSNYQTVVLIKDSNGDTLKEATNGYAEEKEVIIDMGEIKDIPSDTLYVEVYPKYEVAGSEKEGDKFITMIEKPDEIIWPDVSVAPDTTYREDDAGILIGVNVAEGQKFRFSVTITDETTRKVSDWTFIAGEGESKVSTGNLLHGEDYEISVKAESLLYDSYMWENEEDKSNYIEKDYGTFHIRTIPYINPVEFENNLSVDMGNRYAFVYLNPDLILTEQIPVWLRVNKDYSDSSIKALLEEIVVEYSSEPVNNGILSNPEDGAAWDESELEELYKPDTDDISKKTIENLTPGTNYNLRIKTALKFTSTVLYSTIESVTTKNYLKNPQANEISLEEKNGNFYIVIKNYKQYIEANGIDPSKNFYRWKIYNERGELLFPEEVELDNSMVSIKDLSSSYIVEENDTTLKIRLEILNRYVRYEKIYVNFFTYCTDDTLTSDPNIGSEMQQELRGWGFVVESGEIKEGPTFPYNPYQ